MPRAPTVDDHWHHSYGFYLCDTWVQLNGRRRSSDANGRPSNHEFARTGIHSHDDGVIHWHPFSSASVGSPATLGVFLDVYGVELSDDVLQFPEDQRASCPPVPGGRRVRRPARPSARSTARPRSAFAASCAGTTSATPVTARRSSPASTTFALDQDAMVVVIAFVPDGTDVGKPPWIDSFEEDALNDSGQPGTDELFPGVEVDSDGDVTVGTDEIGEEDVGPAVETPVSSDGPTSTDPVTTEVPADETDS